jgi:hypothetical protein
MPGRANDLIVIPDSFWQRSETIAALRDRDMGRFFALVQQYTGASQTQIGMACGGMTQGKISDIMRGVQEVKHLDKFEEIANGLNMPDSARVILGLAPGQRILPQAGSSATRSRRGKRIRSCSRLIHPVCLTSIPGTSRRMTTCDAESLSG